MSKKNVSRVVSGLGLGLGILEGLTAAIRNAGGTDEDIDRLGSEEGREILAKMAKLAVGQKSIAQYERGFLALVESGKYTTVYAGVTPENFPNQDLAKPTTYRLRPRKLPSRSEGYTWKEITDVVAAWKRDGNILDGATPADGLHYGAEQDPEQPNGWVVCTEGTSVDGLAFCLCRLGASRGADVISCESRWFGDDFVLVREVLPS